MDDPQHQPMAAPPMRRRHRRRITPTLFLLCTAIALSCLLLTAFTGYEVYFRDRVILGVSVLGQSMSGQTHEQARAFLQQKFGEPDAILKRTGGQPVILRDGDHTWRAWPWELGLRTNFDPVADSALLLGHRGSFVENLVEQARCLWLRCDIGLEAQFDIQVAQSYLSWLAPQVDQPAQDASLYIQGLSVIATPAKNGRILDGTAMLEKTRRRVLGENQDEIALVFREVPPLVTNVDTAKAKAEAVLAAPVVLTFGNRSWAIDQAALASMVKIQPQPGTDGRVEWTVTLDHAQMLANVKPLAHDINQPARDARFHFDSNTKTLTPIVTSQYGQTLDPEAAAKLVEQQLMASSARVPGPASPLELINARVIALPVRVVKPAIAVEDAAKFGIKELVSQGVSNFKGSTPGRVQNVRTASMQFDGVVVAPGATFSFDQNLGPVDEANGYDDAYVIFQDQTVLGPGGGVCQVSTTVFRAAFWGGFPIAERWAHAYRVGYYEPPVGLDATVFAPSVDFKFKNDTDTYILIEPIVDLKKTTLTFNFWGTKPNRTVEMQDPIQENIIPHGPAVYTNDPTLKKGVTKQVDTAHDGMDVTIWRTIKVNGQVVKKDKFFSRYEPWVARYMVGTK